MPSGANPGSACITILLKEPLRRLPQMLTTCSVRSAILVLLAFAFDDIVLIRARLPDARRRVDRLTAPARVRRYILGRSAAEYRTPG